MVDITGGITTMMAAYDAAKNLKSALDQVADAEVKMKMAELMSALADAKMEASERQTRIAELEGQLSLQEKMVYEKPYYWKQEGAGEKEGPYCQKCYDADQKAIRLQEHGTKGYWSCRACGDFFEDQDYVPESASSPEYLRV